MPVGSIVETNAVFSADSVVPVMAGALPESIYEKIGTVSRENDRMVEAAFAEDLKLCFEVFCESHLLKDLSLDQKRAMFEEMYQGTKKYLSMYQA